MEPFQAHLNKDVKRMQHKMEQLCIKWPFTAFYDIKSIRNSENAVQEYKMEHLCTKWPFTVLRDTKSIRNSETAVQEYKMEQLFTKWPFTALWDTKSIRNSACEVQDPIDELTELTISKTIIEMDYRAGYPAQRLFSVMVATFKTFHHFALK
jgi:hypothetical protein